MRVQVQAQVEQYSEMELPTWLQYSCCCCCYEQSRSWCNLNVFISGCSGTAVTSTASWSSTRLLLRVLTQLPPVLLPFLWEAKFTGCIGTTLTFLLTCTEVRVCLYSSGSTARQSWHRLLIQPVVLLVILTPCPAQSAGRCRSV